MKTLNRILLSPDGEAGTPSAASGVFEPAVVPPVAPETPAVAPVVAPVAAPTPAPTGLSKEELSTILTGAVKAAQPAPAPAQFNQDDFDRTFQVFKPTKELIDAIRAGEEGPALAAIAQMVQGIVKQSVTMSAFQMQQLEDKLSARVAPALTYTQKQSEIALKQEFFGVHKDLEQYEPLVMKVVSDLQTQGTTPASKDAAFKLVSDETRKLLASLKITPASNGGAASPAPTPSQMSTLSRGGQGGAGDGHATATKKSPGLAVFD